MYLTQYRRLHRNLLTRVWCVQALEVLSVADNHLHTLHSGLSSLTSLKQLWAYGNHLQTLPPDILSMPAIQSTLIMPAICASH